MADFTCLHVRLPSKATPTAPNPTDNHYPQTIHEAKFWTTMNAANTPLKCSAQASFFLKWYLCGHRWNLIFYGLTTRIEPTNLREAKFFLRNHINLRSLSWSHISIEWRKYVFGFNLWTLCSWTLVHFHVFLFHYRMCSCCFLDRGLQLVHCLACDVERLARAWSIDNELILSVLGST